MKINYPLITVYITNFNYGKFLNTCIKSVLNQSFKNFELIIIDDGSTDNSFNVLKKFKKKNIRFIFQKNKGLVKTNNIAIRASKAKFVLRLDADDYLDPNALLVLFNEINKSEDTALVYSDFFLINEKNAIIKHERRLSYKNEIKNFNNPAHGACSLIRKRCLEEVNLYDEKFDRQDGIDIWYKFINKYKIRKVSLPLFFYRQHQKNLTLNSRKLLQTRNKILDKFSKIQNVNPKKIKKAVCVIPVRGKVYTTNCMSMEKLKNKPLLFWTIEDALKSKKIDKIIVTTSDIEIIKRLKKRFKNKIYYHKRSNKYSMENTNFTDAVISAINYKYKKNKPNYLLVLGFENPFRSFFYIDTAISSLVLHNSDKVISVNKDISSNFYKYKRNNLVNINNNKLNELKLEKEEIFEEKGGISAYNYSSFLKNFQGNKLKKINYIIMDRKSSFTINDHLDLEMANKVISKIKDQK